MPMRLRRTRPSWISLPTTNFAVLMAMAKLSPCAEMIAAVLTPITSPRELTSGPSLLNLDDRRTDVSRDARNRVRIRIQEIDVLSHEEPSETSALGRGGFKLQVTSSKPPDGEAVPACNL